MLGFLHSGLLAANQSQRHPVSKDSIEAALDRGRILRKAGRFAEALNEFNHALTLARKVNNAEQTARCLILCATVELLSFQYKNALAAAKEALDIARNARLYRLAGAASGTISSIYLSLGDFRIAELEGRRAIELLKLAPQQEPQTRDFLVKALHLQAALCSKQGRIAEGENFFQQAISLSQQIGDKSLEAGLWDDRGVALMRSNRFMAAEQSLNRAFAFRLSLHDEDALPFSKEHLAELELKRPFPNYVNALTLVDEALASNSATFKSTPQFYPIHTRAEILLRSGEKLKALPEFRRAVEDAEVWRRGALPGDTTNTQTVLLLHEVYQDFSHLAAQISLEENDSTLRKEGLSVLAANRAASLREQLKLALATDAELPDSYFQKLSTLQTAQARVTLGGNSKADQADLAKIRAEIDDLENQIAIQIGRNYFSEEKNLRKNSLRDIQSRLRSEQLVLSFSLGETKSYLWIITGDQVNLYQIDGRRQLESKAVQFAKTVREGAENKNLGQELSQALFGALPARLAKKTEWLIVGDGDLLNGIPFAALPALSKAPGELLIEQHTLRFPPSELLLLSPKSKSPAARFIGVADPIYNQADSRLNHKRGWDSTPVEASSVTLARLAGSGQEVRNSARQSGLPDQQVLDGLQASAEALRKALAAPPQLLHFAVHVVSPPDRSQDAALALSLKNGVPELLTPEAIATFRLPGSLVVLSGCSSSQGKAVPSAGLLGLSRAWLLAGAEAVIASSWPTPDDSGRFFSSFYSHLHAVKSGSLSQRAALALAEAQLEMRQGGGYSSSPSYWAAYSVISKE